MEALLQVKNSLQYLVREAQAWIQRIPPRRLYASLGVLSLTTVLISIRSFKRRKSNMIVLAGLSGSGKTVLFNQLRDGSPHQETVTSTNINEGTFMLHSETIQKSKLQPVHLIDIPGDSRLQPVLDKYLLLRAACVIFVVDSLFFLPICHEASEFLHNVLTNAGIEKRKVPVLLLCNKNDKVTAHTKEFVTRQLEREIDKLRVSRKALIDGTVTEPMGRATAETFTFSGCSTEVTIAEGSGLAGEISEVEKFIRDHVKP